MSISFETLALAKRYVSSSLSDALSGITQFDFKFVETLPWAGESGTIYCVQSEANPNIYDEYYYVNGEFKQIPGAKLDLTPYATKEWVNREGFYKKPSEGISEDDLSDDLKEAVAKAKTALQQHQSLDAYRTAVEQDTIDASLADIIAVQRTKPTNSNTKLWVNLEVSSDAIALATMEDLENLKNADIIAVQRTKPTNLNTKLWVNLKDNSDTIAIATMEDLENLKKSLDVPKINGVPLVGDIELPRLGLRGIYYDTTANWNAQPGLIGEPGAIYIYSDYATETINGETINRPNIKIGDGKAHLIDAPFVSVTASQTIINEIKEQIIEQAGEQITASTIEKLDEDQRLVSQEDREKWDNQLTSSLASDDPENLIFSFG